MFALLTSFATYALYRLVRLVLFGYAKTVLWLVPAGTPYTFGAMQILAQIERFDRLDEQGRMLAAAAKASHYGDSVAGTRAYVRDVKLRMQLREAVLSRAAAYINDRFILDRAFVADQVFLQHLQRQQAAQIAEALRQLAQIEHPRLSVQAPCLLQLIEVLAQAYGILSQVQDSPLGLDDAVPTMDDIAPYTLAMSREAERERKEMGPVAEIFEHLSL